MCRSFHIFVPFEIYSFRSLGGINYSLDMGALLHKAYFAILLVLFVKNRLRGDCKQLEQL